ncbi:hypothetical protein FXO38_17438 [Capsicum annuum]|nr:hypothetical protein FXO38_17438 [Capsicum annuum]
MVEEINDPLFGMHIFNIRPFKYLIDQVNVDENELFDVVGEIVGHGAIQSHKQNDKISVFMNVELQDHELNNIEATFGGDFVEQITPCLDGSNTAPVVVVMQFIRAHKFQDKYSVCNTWHASKLWVNPDLPQVVDFKTSKVMDGTGFISLFLWDREATKLIGKSATQLKGQIDETTDFDNDDAYPVELDTILDKNALFKVAIKIHNVEHVEVYTVLKICDDEELTKQFRPSSNDNDFPDSNPDNDLNTLTNTLGKRSLLEVESLGIEIEDDPNAQLSSTKLNKVVKKEKLA